MSDAPHHRAPSTVSVGCAALTVSDTRTPADDESGATIVRLVTEAGHRVVATAIVPDEPSAIRDAIERFAADPDVSVIVSTGGTGISRRDRTIEVVRAMLTAELEGFGELFRMISFEEIGSAAMLSRAVGGLINETFVFAMPGSPNAVATGLATLVLPELRHLVGERTR